VSERAIVAHVSGRVQGVYYRQHTRLRGSALGLAGWVRNLEDGRVMVFAQGPREAVEALVDWLWTGPPHAQVVAVEVDDVPPDPKLAVFDVRH
jgi:acylphosphatase